jgi:RNA polymerase sigma-70 factor (ECF subfamily)
MVRRAKESDAALLERISARDAAGATALYDRYSVDVFSYLRLHASHEDSEDLMQEVFERALRGASRYRGQASVRTWLHSIARYALFERNRRRRPGQTLSELPTEGPGPESQVIEAEDRSKLIAALEGLPEDHAVVMRLHRVDGLSHEEIARRLGIAPATSRKRLERATALLRRRFEFARASAAQHSRVEAWRASLVQRLADPE